MDYQNYNIEDFVSDNSFVNWVLNADFDTSSVWHDFLEKYPEKREEMQLAINLILKIHLSVDDREIETDSNQIWSSLHHKLTYNNLQNKRTGIHRFLKSSWLQVAAILVFVTGLSFLIYTNNDLSDISGVSENVGSKVVKFNPKGRKSTIMLSDKTRVELNAQSKLEYLDQFTPSLRELTLTGEAFFEVERDEDRPFVINVNGITVKVLGTSFNIKGYPGDDEIQVAVASGMVEVYDISSKNYVNLTKNQVADYAYSSADFTKSEILDTDMIFGWKDQKLVFRDQDLNSIVEVLSRWYGVEITMEGVGDNIKRINGVYENATLRQVMEGLAHNYHIKYELNGKNLRIYK